MYNHFLLSTLFIMPEQPFSSIVAMKSCLLISFFVYYMYVSFSSLGLSICKFDDTLNDSHSVPTCFCPFPEGNKENIRHSNYLHKAPSLKREPIELNYYDALQILIFGFGVVTLLWFTYINLCTHSTFVSFNTDLNLYNKKKPASSPSMLLDIICRYVWVVLK